MDVTIIKDARYLAFTCSKQWDPRQPTHPHSQTFIDISHWPRTTAHAVQFGTINSQPTDGWRGWERSESDTKCPHIQMCCYLLPLAHFPPVHMHGLRLLYQLNIFFLRRPSHLPTSSPHRGGALFLNIQRKLFQICVQLLRSTYLLIVYERPRVSDGCHCLKGHWLADPDCELLKNLTSLCVDTSCRLSSCTCCGYGRGDVSFDRCGGVDSHAAEMSFA